MTDRRDRGAVGDKEWQEFRTAFAASRLFALLLDDLSKIAPNYSGELRERLNSGIATGQGYVQEDPDSDGPALIAELDGSPAKMMDLSPAELLEEQLFPDRESDTRDFIQLTRGLAVIALHSSIEGYARVVGAIQPRTPLPIALRNYFRTRGILVAADVSDALTEFDATGHLVVHHAAIVTDRYVRSVPFNNLIQGELRVSRQRM